MTWIDLCLSVGWTQSRAAFTRLTSPRESFRGFSITNGHHEGLMEKSSLLLECFNCARPVSDLNKRRRRVDLRSTNSGVGITRHNGDALMEFILCRLVLNTGLVPPSISAMVRRPNDCSGSKCARNQCHFETYPWFSAEISDFPVELALSIVGCFG